MNNDHNTSIGNIKEITWKFIKDRGWIKYQTPRNLATSISLEASELLENFQWDKNSSAREVKQNSEKLKNIKMEIADVMIYCMNLSSSLGFDLTEALLEKVKQNAKKYPVESFNSAVKDLKSYRETKTKYRKDR